MRKRTWMDVGIALLGLFLVCSAAQAVVQDPDTNRPVREPAQGTAVTGQARGAPQAAGGDTLQQREIARLRAEVARLQQELARMQAQLAQAGLLGTGTGGAGNAETPGNSPERFGVNLGGPGDEGFGVNLGDVEADRQGTGGGGAAGIGDPNAEGVGGGGRAGGAQATRPDTDTEGRAVANVIHTGRVRSVSPRELVLVDEGGGANTLTLSNNVRVFRGRERVSLRSLREGTFVRASADLYARGNPVTEIQVLPSTARRE